MRTVQQGDRVRVRYVKRGRDGRTSSSREPLQLTVGIDHPRLPGLGASLVGTTSRGRRMAVRRSWDEREEQFLEQQDP